MSARITIRCAIYTRKSSEEGLDQDFNSLDAQHEACTAYIASQRHEGWKPAPERYDDGGISGGTLQRPALQRLLAEIDAGRISMVVVYKIDRLTRSLTDFARLVDRFDAAGCSFVSVTQAFNTSTSMGRLTLNVLLSFAQFEREVTAERIRDKIAASKKKGLWMGGLVPLGYDRHPDPKLRDLVVNEVQANIVRAVFRLYDRHHCLRLVHDDLKKTGIRSKRHVFANGKTRGGSVMSRGQIHFLLRNPIYIGQIRHKDKIWPGQHTAIISQDLWDRVQTKLQGASARPRLRDNKTGTPAQHKSRALLIGKLFDETGDRLTPTHTIRSGRRHCYYVSNRLIKGCAGDNKPGWRLPAPALEETVAGIIAGHIRGLAERQALLAEPKAETAEQIAGAATAIADRIYQQDKTALRNIVVSARLDPGRISVTLNGEWFASNLEVAMEDLASDALSITAPFRLRRRGVETRIIAGACAPAPDPTLIRLLAKAHQWIADLRNGKSLAEIAQRDGHSGSYVRTRAHLAFLSPRIQATILDGIQPAELSAARIVRTGIPLDWAEQERIFGFIE